MLHIYLIGDLEIVQSTASRFFFIIIIVSNSYNVLYFHA